MRELIANTFLTLDGVMQAPGGPEEDPSGGFEQGGWSVGYWDEQLNQAKGKTMSTPFDLVLGRKTYEIFAAYWPHNPDAPGAEELNSATKHVASNTLDRARVAGLEPDRGRPGRGNPRAQGAGRPRASGSRQREPAPDAARARAGRRVPPADLPARARQGKAPVRRRHHARGPRARELAGHLQGRDGGQLRTGAEIKYGTFAQERPSEAC